MIDTAKIEATLKRLPGFERLISCDRLSAGASRETYRLQVVMQGAERKLALRPAEGEGVSAMSAGPGLGGEAKLFAAAREAGVLDQDPRQPRLERARSIERVTLLDRGEERGLDQVLGGGPIRREVAGDPLHPRTELVEHAPEPIGVALRAESFEQVLDARHADGRQHQAS